MPQMMHSYCSVLYEIIENILYGDNVIAYGPIFLQQANNVFT